MTAMTGGAPKPRRHTLLVIGLAVVAVVLFSVLVPVHAVLYGTVLPVAMALGAGLCGAPLIALTYPRVAIVVFCVAAFLLPLTISPDWDHSAPWPWSVPALLALAVFVIVVTLLHGWRMGLVSWAVSMVGSLITPLILNNAAADAVAADLIVTASITAAALLIGVLVAGRIRVGEELSRSRELTAIEQSRRALVEERARIARELHDVIAHSMSLIQVQASTARYRIPGLPTEALAEFDDIALVARGSLTEMRRLLGVLRTEDQQEPQLVPQQGIADIPTLVDSIRRAGVAVGLSITAPPSEPPQSVQIAAFRIVQEALSNAVRHAPGAAIEVEVGAEAEAVTVRVHNTAARAAAPATAAPAGAAPAGAGHGLLGMRERVALLAGSLSIGPDPAGGWTVQAVLPWTVGEEKA